MRSASGAGTGPARPGDHLLAAYLAATAALAAATGAGTGLLIGAVHALAIVGLAAMAGRGGARGAAPAAGIARPGGERIARGHHLLRFTRVFLPVVLTPLLYTELETLGQLVAPGYLDATVQGWEAALFGEQLSLTAARRFPQTWLSELLHFGYISYYFVVPGAAIAVYRSGGRRALARLTLTVGTAFFVCYLCFAVFPVAGPRYEFARIRGPGADGVLFGLVHGVLEAGSAKGTAFPSSHVAAAVAALLAARRDARSWYRISLVPVVLLVIGTVYGRFHYAVDALAGLVVAFAAFAATPWLRRVLDGGRGAPSGLSTGNPGRGPGIERTAQEKEWGGRTRAD